MDNADLYAILSQATEIEGDLFDELEPLSALSRRPVLPLPGNLTLSSKLAKTATSESKEKTVAAKTKKIEKHAKRRGWKKPKDKPKRPLSAYNLFFQYQRKKIVQVDYDETAVPNAEDVKQILEEANIGVPKRRVHRKSHGKIGFAQLAKDIAEKWKTLGEESKAVFEGHAAIEKWRYDQEINKWNMTQEAKKDIKDDDDFFLTYFEPIAVNSSHEKHCLDELDMSPTPVMMISSNNSTGYTQNTTRDTVFDSAVFNKALSKNMCEIGGPNFEPISLATLLSNARCETTRPLMSAEQQLTAWGWNHKSHFSNFLPTAITPASFTTDNNNSNGISTSLHRAPGPQCINMNLLRSMETVQLQQRTQRLLEAAAHQRLFNAASSRVNHTQDNCIAVPSEANNLSSQSDEEFMSFLKTFTC